MSAPDPSSSPLLQVSALTLSRGDRTLFENLELRLDGAETLLVRGPNGAGKSSLLLTLAGILRPAAGTITWQSDDTPQLHLLGHAPGVKARLTTTENLAFWRHIYGPTGIAVEDALERVGLGALAAIETGHLSAGQTRRLGLARLLVSRRKVWLLDEPTASLDTSGALLVGQLLGEHAAAGGGAIVATHDAIPLTASARTMTLGGK